METKSHDAFRCNQTFLTEEEEAASERETMASCWSPPPENESVIHYFIFYLLESFLKTWLREFKVIFSYVLSSDVSLPHAAAAERDATVRKKRC